MGRREIFAGNWKMNKTSAGAESLARGIINGLGDLSNREVVIFPPSPYARELAGICSGSLVRVGMQNMHFEAEGAFTGEVSPAMVRDSGCDIVLIGHSERRHVFGETDEDVNKKVRAAFDNEIDPLICVGELLKERENGSTEDVIGRQVKAALNSIGEENMKRATIAYEPVWAIGTGKVATPETAEEVHSFIRELVSGLYGSGISENLPIIYGGSVKPDNIAGLYIMKNIDGVLVGGASLDADSFLSILNVY